LGLFVDKRIGGGAMMRKMLSTIGLKWRQIDYIPGLRVQRRNKATPVGLKITDIKLRFVGAGHARERCGQFLQSLPSCRGHGPLLLRIMAVIRGTEFEPRSKLLRDDEPK